MLWHVTCDTSRVAVTWQVLRLDAPLTSTFSVAFLYDMPDCAAGLFNIIQLEFSHRGVLCRWCWEGRGLESCTAPVRVTSPSWLSRPSRLSSVSMSSQSECRPMFYRWEFTVRSFPSSQPANSSFKITGLILLLTLLLIIIITYLCTIIVLISIIINH